MYGINPNINTFKYQQNYSSTAFGNNEQNNSVDNASYAQQEEGTSFADSIIWGENFTQKIKSLL